MLHRFVPPRHRGRHRISLWYKTAGTIGTGICRVSHADSWGFESQYRPFPAADDWRRLEFEFTVTAPVERAACVIGIHLQQSQPDATLWIDDVRVELFSPEGVASAVEK